MICLCDCGICKCKCVLSRTVGKAKQVAKHEGESALLKDAKAELWFWKAFWLQLPRILIKLFLFSPEGDSEEMLHRTVFLIHLFWFFLFYQSILFRGGRKYFWWRNALNVVLQQSRLCRLLHKGDANVEVSVEAIAATLTPAWVLGKKKKKPRKDWGNKSQANLNVYKCQNVEACNPFKGWRGLWVAWHDSCC